METTYIACPLETFTKLSFQTVLRNEQGETYLNSVNIISDGKVIKKIKYEDENIVFEKGLTEKIALEYILSKLKTVKGFKKGNSKGSNFQKINKKAQKSAINNLMNDLNI